jgi:hypothetical protein
MIVLQYLLLLILLTAKDDESVGKGKRTRGCKESS